MKAEDLNLLLVRRFPPLVDGYLAAKRLWGGDEPGPHVVFGDVLVPFIRTALSGSVDQEQITAVAHFLEDLSGRADNDVLDVVVTSVLEPLLGDPGVQVLESAMGPRTLRLWKRLVADTS